MHRSYVPIGDILKLKKWDIQLDAYPAQACLEGRFGLLDLIKEMDFYSKETDKISSIKGLEEYCRNKGLVNFYGN